MAQLVVHPAELWHVYKTAYQGSTRCRWQAIFPTLQTALREDESLVETQDLKLLRTMLLVRLVNASCEWKSVANIDSVEIRGQAPALAFSRRWLGPLHCMPCLLELGSGASGVADCGRLVQVPCHLFMAPGGDKSGVLRMARSVECCVAHPLTPFCSGHAGGLRPQSELWRPRFPRGKMCISK